MRQVSVALASLLATGCATRPIDAPTYISPLEETAAICSEQFPASQGWVTTTPVDVDVAGLMRDYGSIRYADLWGRLSPADTAWVKNATELEVATCARERCGVDECYWQVRRFTRLESGWALSRQFTVAAYYSQ